MAGGNATRGALQPQNEKRPLTGAALLLHNPQNYMGFIVSPYPTYEAFQKGKLIAHSGTPYGGGADYFSYAQQTMKKHNGVWSDSIASGAKLMGTILQLDGTFKQDSPECTFSVLVYESVTRMVGITLNTKPNCCCQKSPILL